MSREPLPCPPVLLRAAEDRALPSSSVRVLVALQPFVAADGFRPVSITRLSRVLAMDRHTVRDALRALVSRGYLEPGPGSGSVQTYRLVAVPADPGRAA